MKCPLRKLLLRSDRRPEGGTPKFEGDETMFTTTKIALSVAVILGAASAALAQDRGLPILDIQKVCRQDDRAVRSLFSDVSQDYFNNCMDDEHKAREQLLKDWATFSTLAKGGCVRPKEYLVGYVEWLTCLEITRDVIKMRKDNGSEASNVDGRRRCPIVQVGEDGAIKSVVAC